MSENPRRGLPPPGRHRSHRRGEEEGQQPEGSERPPGELTSLHGSKSLERLRERIHQAANEILRLREENAALADRLARLEARSATELDDASVVRFDEDPEVLRRKVAGFIEAIDRYLEREPTT